MLLKRLPNAVKLNVKKKKKKERNTVVSLSQQNISEDRESTKKKIKDLRKLTEFTE